MINRAQSIVVSSDDRDPQMYPYADKFSVALDAPLHQVVGVRLLLTELWSDAAESYLVRVNGWGHLVQPGQHGAALELVPPERMFYWNAADNTTWLTAPQTVHKLDFQLLPADCGSAGHRRVDPATDLRRIFLVVQLVLGE
mgnify:CR=1 FL=1